MTQAITQDAGRKTQNSEAGTRVYSC